MLVQGLIRFPFLPGTHVPRLSKRNHRRAGGSGKARACLGKSWWDLEAGVLNISRPMCWPPAVSAAASCAQMQAGSTLPAARRGSCFLPSFSATASGKPPGAQPIIKVPPRHHPVGPPFTNAATLPLGPQQTGSQFTLHTSSGSPNRTEPPSPAAG